MKTFLAVTILLFPLLAQQREGSFDRTLNVNGPVDLDVETHAGRITVRSGDAATVRIHGVIRANDRASGDIEQQIRQIESKPPVEQTGNTIRITRLADESVRRHLSISYEITTPAASKLRSRTGSGGVTVEGIKGPVDAASGSGSVAITHIGDEVRAHTGSGRIDLDGIRGKVDAQTGSGSIHAREVTGPSVLRTGSGSLHLDQTAAGPVKAHTGSGSVEVHLPGTAGFELHARTGSGGVHVDQPITVSGNVNGHNLRGLVRGGGPLVEVSTGSGPVRID
jgi:hypothetical protein